ncbi:hypothetical protein COT98_02080 [Candidatus Falkowbacteria bacterium CG10_big_fil_rev_8_21_14_0_10_39_9]|uniref:Uncharacterized protein n=1 Tax=Candidatus Falkowbacteria bacterium CG10_big_fil_rev_8_21_14_0_10_39_9 TaxID=1974566 RepID=A0A2M6WPP3_9BACT|nr:MAG: hypothetical protein COT98_02080 [Candidatus Falkowbacteria bacterium CG10_big_fil_rev_8_21_14_0_10_39_9]
MEKDVATKKENKIRFTLVKSSEIKKRDEQKRLWASIPEQVRKQMDPRLKIVSIVGEQPRLIAEFNQVFINVPSLRDEVTGKGAMHMKSFPPYYLVGDNIVGIPAHFSHADRPIYSNGKFVYFSFKRIFYVPKEKLGTSIIAAVEVWRNSNGSLTINIREQVNKELDKNDCLLRLIPLAPQYKIKMRPVGPGEKDSPTIFIVEAAKMALEIITLNKRKTSN